MSKSPSKIRRENKVALAKMRDALSGRAKMDRSYQIELADYGHHAAIRDLDVDAKARLFVRITERARELAGPGERLTAQHFMNVVLRLCPDPYGTCAGVAEELLGAGLVGRPELEPVSEKVLEAFRAQATSRAGVVEPSTLIEVDNFLRHKYVADLRIDDRRAAAENLAVEVAHEGEAVTPGAVREAIFDMARRSDKPSGLAMLNALYAGGDGE
ncbi:MAG: hypothetical protein KC933_35880 [Myxococcales bacterium]|nr:hypothetical protein [Myxococcales bacterium]MCB9645967.1 hypothetical protein [Deltaproteobacteria bacterium]